MPDTSVPSTTDSPFLRRLQDDYSGERYAWFSRLLRGEGIPNQAQSREPVCNVRIVDKVANSSKTNTSIFDAFRATDVNPDFAKVLEETSTDTELRQIVVSYTRVHDLNFSWIEAIGSTLNLDPMFFIKHFERSRERYDYWDRVRTPSLLPLDSKYLQFSLKPLIHTTLMQTSHEALSGRIGASPDLAV